MSVSDVFVWNSGMVLNFVCFVSIFHFASYLLMVLIACSVFVASHLGFLCVMICVMSSAYMT